MSKRRKSKSRKRSKTRRITPRKRRTKIPSSGKGTTAFFEDSSVPKTGFDYGVKPRVMSVFNLEFINSFNESKCEAIGYTVIDQYGVYSDLPVMTLGCQNTNAIKKLFELMKSWMKPPGDQSAVDIFFVEDEKQARYFYCMSVNIKQLILRTFGPGADQDYDILATGGGISKKFAISENYKTFRKFAEHKPVFVTWHEFNINRGSNQNRSSSFTTLVTPNFDSGFIKDDIRFCDVSSLKPNTLEYALIHKAKKQDTPGTLPVPEPNAVSELRRKQLRRFFPVTLARLLNNASFVAAKSVLSSKYKEWQIQQAACNLFARANWPKDGHGKNANMIGIYENLRNATQDATEDASLTFEFQLSELEEQIQVDMRYLHSCVCPGSQVDPKEDLEARGYI